MPTFKATIYGHVGFLYCTSLIGKITQTLSRSMLSMALWINIQVMLLEVAASLTHWSVH